MQTRLAKKLGTPEHQASDKSVRCYNPLRFDNECNAMQGQVLAERRRGSGWIPTAWRSARCCCGYCSWYIVVHPTLVVRSRPQYRGEFALKRFLLRSSRPKGASRHSRGRCSSEFLGLDLSNDDPILPSTEDNEHALSGPGVAVLSERASGSRRATSSLRTLKKLVQKTIFLLNTLDLVIASGYNYLHEQHPSPFTGASHGERSRADE